MATHLIQHQQALAYLGRALERTTPANAIDDEEALSEFTFASLLVEEISDQTWPIQRHLSGVNYRKAALGSLTVLALWKVVVDCVDPRLLV